MHATYDNTAERVSRPEIELLLACARSHISTETANRIAKLVGQITDWDDLITTGNFHGVLPLLYASLSHVCAHAVPAPRLSELRARFQGNSARNLFFAARVLKTLQFLEANGISAVTFKGPTLAALAYGNLALREFSDLDILVQEKDFPKAKALFLAHGYKPWRELTPQEETLHFRSNHAYTLVRSQDGLRLDLHWRITQERYAFGLDVESLWSRLTRTSFFGRGVLSMQPEDLLLVLCLHGSKHCWERLAWICDVAELIGANPELDWNEIMRRSAALNIEKAVMLGLDLASELVDAPLPESVSATIRKHRSVRLLSILIRQRLFARLNRRIGLVERTVLFWMTGERLQNKLPHLAYALGRVFVPNEHDTSLVSLPQFGHILYYPLRLIRLTTARTRGIVGRLF